VIVSTASQLIKIGYIRSRYLQQQQKVSAASTEQA